MKIPNRSITLDFAISILFYCDSLLLWFEADKLARASNLLDPLVVSYCCIAVVCTSLGGSWARLALARCREEL